MMLSTFWNNLSHIGTSGALSQEEIERVKLLNRFVCLAFIPAFLSLFVYVYLEHWMMLGVDFVGCAVIVLILFGTHRYGAKFGWHLGLTMAILFLIGNSLLIKSLYSITIILCTFIFMVNYMFAKSNAKYFYYAFIALAAIIVLVDPVLNFSMHFESAWKINLIYGLIGVSFQFFFGYLYFRQVQLKDARIELNQSEIKKLIFAVQEKNENLELIVRERTQKLHSLNVDLKRSNLDLEQFAYAASHDLKEPLRTIANFLRLLEKRCGNSINEEGKEYLEFAVDGAKRMSFLINDLLEYSQVGNDKLIAKPCDTSIVVEKKILDLSQKIYEKKGTVIQNNLPKKLICVPNQIGILLYNLINNGIKFNQSENPKVQVEAVERKRDWLFTVTDNGIGISEKNKEKIFEIFRRLHAKGEYDGSGIGLAICKKIVARHKGEIWVESAKGMGTTFFFTIQKIVQQSPANINTMGY